MEEVVKVNHSEQIDIYKVVAPVYAFFMIQLFKDFENRVGLHRS